VGISSAPWEPTDIGDNLQPGVADHCSELVFGQGAVSKRPDCLHDCCSLLDRLETKVDTDSPVATALADSSRSMAASVLESDEVGGRGATNWTLSQLERVRLATHEERHRHDTVRSAEIPHERLDADDLATVVNVFSHPRHSNRGSFVYRLAIDLQSD